MHSTKKSQILSKRVYGACCTFRGPSVVPNVANDSVFNVPHEF